MKVRNRHHLRNDEIKELKQQLERKTGIDLPDTTYERVDFESDDVPVILIDGNPYVALFEDEYFLTVRGANELDPSNRFVTVDTGAISFVSDGADIMRPGIVDVDPAIRRGNLVLVNEEAHGKILAIGRALTDGDDMIGDSGKVVKSIHYVGDDLYNFTP